MTLYEKYMSHLGKVHAVSLSLERKDPYRTMVRVMIKLNLLSLFIKP